MNVDFLTDPWQWWIQPFLDNGFMQRALLAALLAVIVTSVVGTWVVLRGLSFLGDALAHGVLPGVALAWVIGVDPGLGAMVAALLMVGGVTVVKQRSSLPEDTSIGVLFVGFLALAVVIMSARSGSYGSELNGFLFGSVLGVDRNDLIRQAVAAVVAVTGVAALHRPLLVSTFDPVQAEMLGFRPRLTHGMFLALMAIAIVASYETVGTLLVFAFLVAPPATASLLVRRVPVIMATSVLLGAGSAILGLLISFHHGTAAGATMALVSVMVFAGTLLLRPPHADRAKTGA